MPSGGFIASTMLDDFIKDQRFKYELELVVAAVFKD